MRVFDLSTSHMLQMCLCPWYCIQDSPIIRCYLLSLVIWKSRFPAIKKRKQKLIWSMLKIFFSCHTLIRFIVEILICLTKIKLIVFVFRKQTSMAPFWKEDAMPYCATGNVDRNYFQQNKLDLFFKDLMFNRKWQFLVCNTLTLIFDVKVI